MKILRLSKNNELLYVELDKIKNREISVEQLKKFVENKPKNNLGYSHPDWPSNIWSKSLDEIVDFLKDRFKTTSDEAEYYHVMKLLYKHVDEEDLLIPFSSISGTTKSTKIKGKKKVSTGVYQGSKKKPKSNLDKDPKTSELQAEKPTVNSSKGDKPQKFGKFNKSDKFVK